MKSFWGSFGWAVWGGIMTFTVMTNYFGHGVVPKTKVVECFKDVDWSTNTFQIASDGPFLTNKRGETHFYRVPPIDEAIKKLNKLMEN